ncbi:hypothetical protein JCGZ_03722 [Jatropha curcas]|uniref:Uncharacterized protein n=1 Tax=Jatropha curcas TaxID=180498 RepID=A0A067L4L4_JATCU|nr:hypothetical protein JCGZ_03722 [Jatropha curcas]
MGCNNIRELDIRDLDTLRDRFSRLTSMSPSMYRVILQDTTGHQYYLGERVKAMMGHPWSVPDPSPFNMRDGHRIANLDFMITTTVDAVWLIGSNDDYTVVVGPAFLRLFLWLVHRHALLEDLLQAIQLTRPLACLEARLYSSTSLGVFCTPLRGFEWLARFHMVTVDVSMEFPSFYRPLLEDMTKVPMNCFHHDYTVGLRMHVMLTVALRALSAKDEDAPPIRWARKH